MGSLLTLESFAREIAAPVTRGDYSPLWLEYAKLADVPAEEITLEDGTVKRTYPYVVIPLSTGKVTLSKGKNKGEVRDAAAQEFIRLRQSLFGKGTPYRYKSCIGVAENKPYVRDFAPIERIGANHWAEVCELRGDGFEPAINTEDHITPTGVIPAGKGAVVVIFQRKPEMVAADEKPEKADDGEV